MCSRITPAHAGKSHRCIVNRTVSLDHPRTCGEKHSDRHTVPLDTGSPPHMRGKDQTKNLKMPLFRITPAHAGKSFIYPMLIKIFQDHPRTCGEKLPIFYRRLTQKRDHPRTCGEKFFFAFSLKISPGSPPHMRGKDKKLMQLAHPHRITPAHAGKRSVLYP